MGITAVALILAIVELVVGQEVSWDATQGTRLIPACLASAVPKKFLRTTNADFPIGIWNLVPDASRVDAATAIFYYLASEVLGYYVQIEPFPDPSSSSVFYPSDALHALAGCEQDAGNWVCTGQATKIHVALGISLESPELQRQADTLNRQRIGGLFQDLGDMGYVIRHGIYVKGSTAAKALANRVFLDDPRTYNVSQQDFFTLYRYFSDISEIDAGRTGLVPCDRWKFSANEILNYHNLSDVLETFRLIEKDGELVAKCSNSNWWLAKSCKQNCIPFLTQLIGDIANQAMTLMFKATMLDMPIALGVADGFSTDSDFYNIVRAYDVLHYFWEPDVTFKRLDPVMIVQVDVAVEPRVLASTELARLAPDACELLSNIEFSLEDIHEMMSFGDSAGVPNSEVDVQIGLSQWFLGDAFDGACQWIQNNSQKWLPWIPSKTSCMPGQGLFSHSFEPAWLQGWDSMVESECRACPPGRFSMQIPKGFEGDTAICRLCSPGGFQPSFSAEACQLCPAGTLAPSHGAERCIKCAQGQYQHKVGSSFCEICPGGKTTLQGARSVEDCECQDGTIQSQASGVETVETCVTCPVGLICEKGKAEQLPGFWANPSDLSVAKVFQCRDQLQCPGGAVGSCAVGRKGRACGSCIKGYASEFDGTCAPCGGRSLWPILVMLLVTLGAIPLILVAGIFASRARRAALSIFMVSIIFGQVVVCLQALDAIYQLDIAWIDPAKAILQSLAVFNLDLDFSCVLPPQDYILEYAVQVTAYPVVLLITFLIWLTLRWASKQVPFNAFVNAHGLLIVALLTAMTLTILRPLQCKNNPSGLFTIASRPDIICWETAEHLILFWLALAGILAYPVTILASIAYLTMKYPVWLRSGGGIEIMERYRFLFARFRPERYYYGLILCAHNLIVAVIPAALASMPALQVGIMGIVICLKLIVQILLWPWRLEVANYNDLALSAGLLILLLLASPLLNISQEETLTFVAILLSSVMVVLPLVAMFAALAVVFARLRPQSKFAAFLCHHKAGAGALCRFFKLVAKKYVKINIFLDSDELDDLSRIFDVVRADTKCLVVVLTSELLNRMWCAGEIASAHKNKVPIIPLYCDGYAFPDHDSIDVIESVWTEEQQSTLISHGISMDDIKAAYKHVSKLKSFAFCRFWTLEEQEEKILQVVAASSQFSAVPKVLPSSVAGARILVCVRQVPESISVGLILQQMVQHHLRSATHTLQTEEEIYEAKKAFGVLFVLSHGVLEDVLFARCLLACRQRSMQFVPVNDGTFQFPLPDFISEVEHGRHEVIGPEGLSPNIGPLLAKAYQALLSILALPLTAHGSSGILERQVAQICQRFGEDEPRMHRAADVERVDSGTEEDKAADAANSGDLELECESVKSINTDDLWHV